MKLKTLALVAAFTAIPAIAGAQTANTTSSGPECARGCPTSSGVAGLTGAQFLALQQELRDRGCGNTHVTGVLDAPTRKAIKTCAAKLNVEATPAAVLTAMNIGYTVGSGTAMLPRRGISS